MKHHLLKTSVITLLASFTLGQIILSNPASTTEVEAEFTPVPVSEYYKGINLTHYGDDLKDDLYQLIKGHTKYSYGVAEKAMRQTDRDWVKSPNPDDEKPIMVLLYADYNDTNPITWNKSCGSYGDGSDIWNKEHIWAKSNGFPSKGLQAYCDLHHLRASDEKLNNWRSNYPLGNSNNAFVPDHFENTSTCRKATPFEPGDKYKGDVARALFYMATRYYTGDGSGGTKLALTTGTDSSGGKWGYLNDLLAWHELDPVDDFERNRNQIIYEDYQHNRNPYIDHPEFARAVFKKEPIVEPKTLTNLVVTGSPTQKNYKEGATFNPNGLTVTAYFDDDSHEVVTTAVKWDKVTSTSVNGTYTYGTVSKTVTVSGLTIIEMTGLTYSGTPTTTTYDEGQSFNPAGLTVYANYSDSSKENVTSEVTWSPDPLTYGVTSVTGQYSKYYVTINGITVNKVTSVEYTIKFSDNGSDCSEAMSATTALNYVSEGKNYVSSLGVSKAYKGKTGVKLGSSSATGYVQFNLSSEGQISANKVTVGIKKYGSDTGKVKVTTSNNETESFSPTDSLSEVSLELSGKTITYIKCETTSKRAYLSYIKVSYKSSEDTDPVQTWIDNYMHMSDPDYSGSGTGLCKSSGTYLTAKIALMSLDVSYRNNFENNVDNKYTLALARYLAWDKANEDESPFNGTTIIKSDYIEDIYKSSQPYIILMIIASLLLTTTSITLIIKKKRK